MNAEEQIVIKYIRDHLSEALPIIEDFEPKEIAQLLEALPANESASTFSRMTPHVASKVCAVMKEDHCISILQQMPIQAGEHLLRLLEAKLQAQLLSVLPQTLAEHFKLVLQYPKDTVGAALNPLYLAMTPKRTVHDAVKMIKLADTSIGSCMYIVTNERKLLGLVELKDLIIGTGEQELQQLMKPIAQQASAEMTLKELIESWDSPHDQLPVADSKGFFMGVVEKTTIEGFASTKRIADTTMIQAGNALGDVYLIGLTGLFGSTNITDSN